MTRFPDEWGPKNHAKKKTVGKLSGGKTKPQKVTKEDQTPEERNQ